MSDETVKKRVVYLLCHEGSDMGVDVYVGSTSQTLAKRLRNHKFDSERIGNEDNKLYKRMQTVGLENWVMRPLFTLECTRDEIRVFERMWCNILRSDINSSLPIRTMALAYGVSYRRDVKLSAKCRCEVCGLNFESRKDRGKHNKGSNHKQVYLFSLGLRSSITQTVKEEREYDKRYYQNNKEVLRQKKAEYHQNNKDVIKQRYQNNIDTKKYYCDVCDKPFHSNWKLNQHKDSLKHQFTFLNSLD